MPSWVKTLLVAVVTGIISWALAGSGMALYRQAEIISQWPSTEGVILSGSIDRQRVRRFRLGTGRRLGPRYRYSAKIAYRYSVDGQEYVSNQISAAKQWEGRTSQLGDEADAAYEGTWLAKFPEGKTVAVYYDPDDPANAVLERDDYVMAYALLGAAGVLALLTLWMFRLTYYYWQESRLA